MPKPKKHVFVCTQSRQPGHPRGSCTERGCQAVLDQFQALFSERDLYGRLALASTSCLGGCRLGPNVLVYPDGVMYGKVTPADVPEIIEKHLLADEPVERLQIPDDLWG